MFIEQPTTTRLYFSKVEGVLHIPGLHSALPLHHPCSDHPFDGDGGHCLVGRRPCEVAAAPLYLWGEKKIDGMGTRKHYMQRGHVAKDVRCVQIFIILWIFNHNNTLLCAALSGHFCVDQNVMQKKKEQPTRESLEDFGSNITWTLYWYKMSMGWCGKAKKEGVSVMGR